MVKLSIRRAVPRVAALLFPLAVVLLLEGVLRVGVYTYYGYSEYYLYYGFHSYVGRVGISPEWTNSGRHFKFPPNYTLRNAAGQAEETATINALGFRGPDFEPRKPGGTFRVVCLGESSTFGFHNRDTDTYPYLLQQLAESQPRAVRVEVINAGFPYYNSGSILSLLQSEIFSYDPDVLTIYSAYNDAAWPLHVGAIRPAGLMVPRAFHHVPSAQGERGGRRVHPQMAWEDRSSRVRPEHRPRGVHGTDHSGGGSLSTKPGSRACLGEV